MVASAVVPAAPTLTFPSPVFASAGVTCPRSSVRSPYDGTTDVFTLGQTHVSPPDKTKSSRRSFDLALPRWLSLQGNDCPDYRTYRLLARRNATPCSTAVYPGDLDKSCKKTKPLCRGFVVRVCAFVLRDNATALAIVEVMVRMPPWVRLSVPCKSATIRFVCVIASQTVRRRASKLPR